MKDKVFMVTKWTSLLCETAVSKQTKPPSLFHINTDDHLTSLQTITRLSYSSCNAIPQPKPVLRHNHFLCIIPSIAIFSEHWIWPPQMPQIKFFLKLSMKCNQVCVDAAGNFLRLWKAFMWVERLFAVLNTLPQSWQGACWLGKCRSIICRRRLVRRSTLPQIWHAQSSISTAVATDWPGSGRQRKIRSMTEMDNILEHLCIISFYCAFCLKQHKSSMVHTILY